MVTISIVELENHGVILESMLNAMQFCDCKLKVFTKRSLVDEACFKNHNFIEWNYLEPNKGVGSYLKKHRESLNNSDLVFITTIEQYFKYYYRLKLDCKTLVRIHNVNYFFRPLRNIKIHMSLRGVYKACTHFIRNSIFFQEGYYKIKFRNTKPYITFFEESISAYVKSQGLYPEDLITPCIPQAYTEFCHTHGNSEYFHFIVSGNIEKKRKDYTVLINAFKKALPQFNKRVKLTLLGQPQGTYGKEVISDFKELTGDSFSFQFYREFVNYDEFRNQMQTANCIIAPVRVNTYFKVVRETYGQTKATGVVGDAIRFNKTAIIPNSMAHSGYDSSYFDPYNSEAELTQLLIKHVNTESLTPNDRKVTAKRIHEPLMQLIKSSKP